MEPQILTTISPVTNQPIHTRSAITEVEIPLIAQKAELSFSSFRRTFPETRRKIVLKALQLLEQDASKLGQDLSKQIGRPVPQAEGEIHTAVSRGRYLVQVSEDALKDTPGEPEEGFVRYIKKAPVGPVLIIFAWNYPYLILVNSLVPALLAGNSVILKPSPQTPTVAEHALAALAAAGLPDGVVRCIHCGDPPTLRALVRRAEVKLVCFTGSVAGGLAVQRAAADRVDVRVGLELGGNDPAYVRADVDVRWAAQQIVDGAVYNAGQSCCAVERVYVAAEIHDEFVKEVAHVLEGYVLGDPTDVKTNLGPVISKAAVDTVKRHVSDAIALGAEVVAVRNESFENAPPQGNYVAPVVLTNVNHDMAIMKEETFGPVIPIMKVARDQEAVRLMNDSEFGLSASIWTKDVAFGKGLAEVVEAGTVFVNRCDYPSPDLAWTGWKNSGKGQTLSRFGFDQFVKLKSFHVKDYPV